MVPADTTREAARVQRAVFARMTGPERVLAAFEMSQSMRRLTMEGIRRREPDLDEDELMLRLIEILHGPALAAKVAATRER